VVVNPGAPIPEWDLSETSRQRLEVLLTQPWLKTIGAVFCSDEQNARTTTERIAAYLNLAAEIISELGEIDRSATGYLERSELIPVVAAFFVEPHESSRGWERAADAQMRTIRAVEGIISRSSPGANIAVVGHGGVGTLLLNHIKGTGITQADAPPRQGYYFAFTVEDKRRLHPWKPIDHFETV
jgi:broad specificity phosphatase PhoE